ncbi:probable protein kinase DDB_G0277539 [Penaeus indicus]|uniref:probable protein kinase DDB_G0277539 n=1 Tax=Penaeus indicus TaxID=29960 RepID=UPI00300CA36A
MSLEHVRIPFPPSPTFLTVGSTTLQDPRPSDTLLQELRAQLSAFTSQHLRESVNASRALQELLSGRTGLDAEVGRMGGAARDLEGHRGRRQIVTPDLGALQSGYTRFFGGNNRRHHTSSSKKRKKKKKKNPGEDDMPIVLVPEESAAECVSNNQLSSFGFLGFVLNVVNAVINVANNLNNNDNSNNDNDNNNNNNDGNTNQVAITETATNDNPPVMAIAGRRVQRLKMMRTALSSHLRSVRNYRTRNRRSGTSSSRSCIGGGGRDDDGDGEGGSGSDVVDEALVAAVALMDMWKEVLFEEDPVCMALEFCDAAGKLGRVSRLAGMMAQVAAVAAANMLQNFQGVNPDYLIKASEAGAEGENCALVYSACYLQEDEDFGRVV